MKKLILAALLTLTLCRPCRIQAIEPASMIEALPQAIALANLWSPHIQSALRAGGSGFVMIGQSCWHIIYLPYGLGECILGGPFGYFWQGVNHTVTGFLAPADLVYQCIMLPVRFFSLGAVN